jgi:hypothetical protein
VKAGKQGKVEVISGYGGNTRLPYIELRLPDRPPLQLEIDEARIVGQMILEACEAAEGDAFLVEFMQERIGIDMPGAANILVEFRTWREKRRNKRKAKTA